MIVERSRIGPDVAVVTVSGDVDLDTAGQLRLAIERAVEDGTPREVRVDLGAVPFMDSLGISALLAGYRAAAAAGVTFRVVALTPGLTTVLEMTGVLDLLGYEKPGYEPPSYERPSYERPSYERPGYERPGYERPGYEPPSSSIAR